MSRLVEMGQRFLTTGPYASRIQNSPEQMERVIQQLMEHEGGLVLVADLEGWVGGMILVFLHQHPLSGEVFASELCWWVEPEVRGRTGLYLLTHAEVWAQEHGARAIHMVAPSPEIAGLYERLGYDLLEMTYTKELQA